MRARVWLPEVGVFSAIDELAYHDARSTLCGWPGQSPVRWADLDGRCGWLCAGAAVVAIGIAYGYIFASDDAAAQRAAHPEAAASPARGIALSAGVLAPVSAVSELGSIGQGAAAAAPAAGALGSGGLGGAAASSQSCAGRSSQAGASASGVLNFTSRNLQKGFDKHGADFGLSGNWNPGRAADFSRAINQHVNSPSVTVVQGTYRGSPATHYFDPSTGLNVVADQSGNYVTGLRLGVDQMQNLLRSGALQ